MMHIQCTHCGHEWHTKSTAKRISCSKCKTSIRGHHPEIPDPPSIIEQLTEVKFSKALWKDVRLSQRFMALDNMGETYITLKVDSNGILSL